MKIRFLLLLLTVCTYFPIKAQMNLVPNPSFEDVLFCPNGLGQIYVATPWENYRISPDIFCECSPFGLSVPQNHLGYQFAHSGNCMAGVITFRKQSSPNGPNTREFLGVELIQPLVIGTEYFFSGYINCSGGLPVVVSANNFGMKLLTYGIDSSLGHLLVSNSATIFSDSLLSDTTSWFKISGSFIADSTYTHMVLGNFFDDSNTDTLTFQPGFIDYSYYFVDDICLSADSNFCGNWTSIHDVQSNMFQLTVYPNPTFNNIQIESNRVIESISIANSHGKRVIYLNKVDRSSYNLLLVDLSPGVYFMDISSGENKIYKKFVKL